MEPVRILLIDDDEDDFILTRELLKENPLGDRYVLDWCNSYTEGLNALLKNQYDVYLVDFRLGRRTGIDLLKEASRFDIGKPVIIFTGKGDFRADQDALKSGASDYLIKDEITATLLERTIRYNVERYKNLQKIKSSESTFRLIFERSKDTFIITDPSGKIHEANAAAAGFFEESREGFLLQNAFSLFKDQTIGNFFIRLLQEKGSVSNFDIEMLTCRNAQKPASISAFLQFAEEKGTELYYLIIHDLSNRLQQEARKVMEGKLAAVGRIAKTIAAETYNPLSNINLAVDELLSDNPRQEDLILLDLIRKNCDRISDLTSQLIEATQLSSLKKEKLDINEVLRRAAAEAESLFNLQIEATFPEQPVWLSADCQGIHAAFVSIFQNAADASPAGSAKVRLAVRHQCEVIAVDIEDEGEGIAEEDLDKIFEPFFTTRSRSSGLGLTYSQRVIAAHHGTLTVRSKKDQGTTVSVFLPA